MSGASRFKEDPSSSRQGNHLEHTTHTCLFSAETKADEFGTNLKKIPLALGWVAIWIYTTQMSIESDSVQNEGRREFGANSYARRKTHHLILSQKPKIQERHAIFSRASSSSDIGLFAAFVMIQPGPEVFEAGPDVFNMRGTSIQLLKRLSTRHFHYVPDRFGEC